MADFKAAATRADEDALDEAEEQKRAAALEAELEAAQTLVETAESRYQLACRQVKDELAKPLKEATATGPSSVGDGPGLVEVEAQNPSDNLALHRDRATSAAKNTSARTEKELSSEKWLKNKAAQGRVKDKAKKAREILRRNARDKRMQYAEGDFDAAPEAPPAEPAKAPAQAPKERSPLWESEEVKAGAKSLAARLEGVKGRPSAADKKDTLLKVLIGGRENYYTSQPIEILNDLVSRGHVEASLTAECKALLSQEVAKGGAVPKEEWLAHAQKMSGVEAVDRPFQEHETMYLKWMDTKNLLAAEAELDAAEARLEEMLKQVDACLPDPDAQDEQSAPAEQEATSGQLSLDEEYADYLATQHEVVERESKGSKNASALSEKVLSKDKWLAARGAEKRQKEQKTIAREARRGEARDIKANAGNVD